MVRGAGLALLFWLPKSRKRLPQTRHPAANENRSETRGFEGELLPSLAFFPVLESFLPILTLEILNESPTSQNCSPVLSFVKAKYSIFGKIILWTLIYADLITYGALRGAGIVRYRKSFHIVPQFL